VPKYKIILDRIKCIGALNCIGASPEFWKQAKDGKVDLAGSKEVSKGKFEVTIDEKYLKKNTLAMKSCPAKAIKIEKI